MLQSSLQLVGLKPLNREGNSVGSPNVLTQSPTSKEAQRKRILIVDDSDEVRRSVRAFLEVSGYSCSEAADGVEAITKARNSKPDLIVMDLVMPGINGIEATSVIRSTMPRMPIIAFTMYEGLAKSMTSKLAINTVVSKPEGLAKLVECIQSVLGSVS